MHDYYEEIDPGSPLGKVLQNEEFCYRHLAISGIDNEPVLAKNSPEQREEEIDLFHRSVLRGDDYVSMLAERIETSVNARQPLPVVRFADGEYAFYSGSMKCNGLYQQAESVAAIRAAIPEHMEDIRYLSMHGVMATLVFPGNVRRPGLLSMFRKKKGNDMALRFLELLSKHDIGLSRSNYIPFYVVYAYLSSERFAKALDGKTVCIVNSDYNEAACADWFVRAGSQPSLVHVPIPASYVATQWSSMRDEVFRHVPENPDCFMVGAGIGALQACVDLSRSFSAPAIDSGHILNMMNDLERKSAGPRLYTYRR